MHYTRNFIEPIKMTQEQVHKTMSAIRGKDTKPEMLVRRFLWHRGFRFLVNVRSLPGKPDVVLRGKYRICLFVNGCFWHGHKGCYSKPKTNVAFWERKVERNQERDGEVRERLRNMGWHCVTVWECELKPTVRKNNLEKLERTIRMIAEGGKMVRGYDLGDELVNGEAAENGAEYQ